MPGLQQLKVPKIQDSVSTYFCKYFSLISILNVAILESVFHNKREVALLLCSYHCGRVII